MSQLSASPNLRDLVVRLAAKNQSDAWTLSVYAIPGCDKLYPVANPEGLNGYTQRKKEGYPWEFERLELWAGGKMLFAIPTVSLKQADDNNGLYYSPTHPAGSTDQLILQCHMLPLNGGRENNQLNSRLKGVALNLKITLRAGGKGSCYLIGKIGDQSIGTVDYSYNSLVTCLLNNEKGPFYASLAGKETTVGPLLESGLGDPKITFSDISRLYIRLNQDKQTLEMVYQPSSDLSDRSGGPLSLPMLPNFKQDEEDKPTALSFQTPVPVRRGDFTIPVIRPTQGSWQKYTLTQRPTDDWLGRRCTEEYLITVDSASFKDIWNVAVQRYKNGLRTVRSTNRLTLLPEIEHALLSKSTGAKEDDPNVRISFRVWRKPPADGDDPRTVKTTDLLTEPFTVEQIGDLSATLCFDLGRQSSGASSSQTKSQFLRFPATLKQKKFAAMKLELEAAVSGSAAIEPKDVPLFVRIGSLDLQFGGEVPEGAWNLNLETLDWRWGTSPRFSAKMMLPVADVIPGGQDGPPSIEYVPEAYAEKQDDIEEQCMEERFTGLGPVVVPLGLDSNKPLRGFLLQAEESNPLDHSQTVFLKLLRGKLQADAPHRTGDADKPTLPRVIVLDSDPFLVAAVDYKPLAPAGNSDIVALWSTGTNNGGEDAQRAWQLQTGAQPFTLTLPPQVLGEEMPKATELADKDKDPVKALDFRLGAAMPQVLNPSYQPQNFTEAPWNMRRILGYPGQRDAGAGVVQLNYELLYGLSCSVDTPLLRLAEALSLLGRIPGRIAKFDFPEKDFPQKDWASKLYHDLREIWSEYAQLYSKRVAMLEPRASGSAYGTAIGLSGDSGAPESFTLSQGVSCRFRTDADLYYEVDKPDKDPSGNTFNEKTEVVNPDGTVKSPAGLKGGVTWPFESPRLLYATVRNPKSSSASVSGLMLSPLGGTGTAKAGFDRDLSVITAVTNVGRTNKVTIARLGRIAVFHNLARYVIEYERDVSVSEQFNKIQTDFSHRPVLRKVREYVEVLEPVAALSNSAQPIPAGGCVKSIEFKQHIIPVLNKWSSNVGDTGWKIPLWYEPASHPAQAGQYKYERPDVVFNMAGADSPDAASNADVECAIQSVDRLYFYTRTDADADANPHNWPIVSGLDFLPVPAPTANPAFTSSSVHELAAYDPPAPFGLQTFTHDILPGHGRVNLVYGRTAQAVGAVLNSVTLQRGPQGPSGQIPALQSTLGQVRDIVRGDLFTAVRSAGEPDRTHMISLAQQVCDTTTTLCAQVQRQAADAIKNVVGREEMLLANWVKLVDSVIDTFSQEMEGATAKYLGQPAAEVHDQLVNAVTETIQNLQARLNALPASANVLAQFAANVQQQLSNLSKALNAPHTMLTKALGAMHAANSHDTVVLQEQLDFFTEQLDAPLQEVQAALAQARSQVQSRAEAWMVFANLLCHFWEDPMAQSMAAVRTVLNQAQMAVSYAQTGADDQIDAANLAIKKAISDAVKAVDDTSAVPLALLTSISFPDPLTVNCSTPSASAQEDFCCKLNGYVQFATALPDHIKTQMDAIEARALVWVDGLPTGQIAQQQIEKLVTTAAQEIRGNFNLTNGPLATLQKQICDNADRIAKVLALGVKTFGSDVCARVSDLQNAAVNGLESARRVLEDSLSRCAESLAQALPVVDISLPPGGSVAAMLQHAFGAVPEIPNLGFSLPNVGYFFNPLDAHVNLTPLLTEVRDLSPNLSPLSTSLPCFALSDRMLPVPHLPNFDLSNIFPDFAGLQLTNLFPALKMPLGSSDAVKVTHGLDRQSRTAWVQADIDLKTDTATIFAAGPMALQIVAPEFTSTVRAQANSSGQVSKQATGAIKGDWQLVIGGSPMVTLAKTSLNFDKDGKLHVDVSPDRVELSDALAFIQQIVAMYSSPDSGFGIYPSATGIETRLALPIPDTSMGTTGITNLTFNFLFGLRWAPQFSLYAGFGLASATAPFNLAVYILGGGGYLTATANYVPGGKLTCSVDMGIDVSAALAISLGPISGGVHVNLGMRFQFDSGHGDLALGFYLIIAGEVSVLGILSASITLRLDAMYSNGSFQCHGLFQISVKICWCFTLSVSEEVSCRLGSGGGLAYKETPTLPGADPLPMIMFDNSVLSSVPTPEQLAKYLETANKYMQLIS